VVCSSSLCRRQVAVPYDRFRLAVIARSRRNFDSQPFRCRCCDQYRSQSVARAFWNRHETHTLVTQLVSIAAGQTITFNTPLGAATSEVIRGGEALYVDISHPYDADTANNHGESVVSLQGSGNTYSIPIGNFTEQPLVYVFSLAPNNVAAQISDTQLTIAPQDQKFVQISFTIPPTRPFETSVTLLAHDLQGKLLGGVTHQLYF
jgi:hypothetical protein